MSEEENILLRCQHNPELIEENAGHGHNYYGVVSWTVRQADKPPIILEIEAYLATKIPDFTRFCNFKTNKDGTMSVRYLSMWSPQFEGVGYNTVAEIIASPTNEEYAEMKRNELLQNTPKTD